MPLGPGGAERLAYLYGQFGTRVRRSVVNRLVTCGMDWAEAVTLGDDIAQNLWLDVARKGRELLATGPEALDDVTARRYLLARAKHAVGAHWGRKSAGERPADFTAPEWRAVAAGPMVLTDEELSDRCRELLAQLPERMRAAMVEVCHGVPVAAIAERLGISRPSAQALVDRAAAKLRGESSRAACPASARTLARAEDLEPVRLEELPADQRRVLEAAPERDQAVLLLRLAGASYPVISHRLGHAKKTLTRIMRRYADVLPLDQAQRRDGIPAARLEDLPADQRRALEELPEQERMVLLLRLAGLSYGVIAKRLGIADRTAWRWVQRNASVLTGAGVAA